MSPYEQGYRDGYERGKDKATEEIAGLLREERDRLRELIRHSPTEAARCTTSGRIAALTDAVEMVEEYGK